MNVNEYFKQFYPSDWKGEDFGYSDMLGGMRRYIGSKAASNIFPRVQCADGVSLSVQAHFGSYSTPRDDYAPSYSTVEVGFIRDADDKPVTPPDSWKSHADGEFPSDVYGYVPVDMVEQFIESHGGVAA